MAHDIVIRGGELVDGTGGAPRQGDLAIDGNAIAAVGKVEGSGKREIDAQGLAVTPGFVDLHTHLDAQIGWDPQMTPVSWHGVTTALLGNCGVTFAPCKPADVDLLAAMMETVEDIPKNAILTGLPWDWEDYGGYLDAIERLNPALNVAGMVGHCAVRFYVMGERAVEEQATAEERAQMADVVAKSMDGGAVGFSTNRYPAAQAAGRALHSRHFRGSHRTGRNRQGGGAAQRPDAGGGRQLRGAEGDGGDTKGRILFSYGTGPQEGSGKRRRRIWPSCANTATSPRSRKCGFRLHVRPAVRAAGAR